ncbi:copper resistance CopC family protein [Cryobacterium sp. PH31-O1]|uniref:copper resistance CopC family protein n=1 Tax=Cryobacterium sp. PH31-O1 TaxID=3046306 RepID=UPI0024B8A762|nr:copper resistance CopC family protein [Cryobacterium sp. PH31-O1]MDJ0337999.1 copper resistance protein CopC [Cryobacterium sp. PH31-O1]
MRGNTTTRGPLGRSNGRAAGRKKSGASTPSVVPAGRRAASAVFAVVVVAAALGWGAAPASAHNYVVDSSPAADTVVTEQPGVFSVTTNDLLLDLGGTGSGSAMVITGPASAPLFYGDGCATVSGATVETAAQLGAAGEYTVIWQTVSTDGHAISDEFQFDWQPTAGQTLADGAPAAVTCGAKADATTTDTATSPPADTAADSSLSTLAWIGGTVGAVLLAIIVTLLLLRRKPRP